MFVIMHTDGGARGNPGPAAAGVILSDKQGIEWFAGGFYLGNQTNNVAEYAALLKGLELAREMGAKRLEIRCDSELVVKQVNGQYKVKNETLKDFHRKVCAAMSDFDAAEVCHVYRKDNARADAMVNRAIDAKADVIEQDMPGGGVKLADCVEDDSHEQGMSRDICQLLVQHTARPMRMVLNPGARPRSEVIALKGGQTITLDIARAWTLMTLRGSGTLGGRETMELAPGMWVGMEPAGQCRVCAAEEGELVIILNIEQSEA